MQRFEQREEKESNSAWSLGSLSREADIFEGWIELCQSREAIRQRPMIILEFKLPYSISLRRLWKKKEKKMEERIQSFEGSKEGKRKTAS